MKTKLDSHDAQLAEVKVRIPMPRFPVLKGAGSLVSGLTGLSTREMLDLLDTSDDTNGHHHLSGTKHLVEC